MERQPKTAWVEPLRMDGAILSAARLARGQLRGVRRPQPIAASPGSGGPRPSPRKLTPIDTLGETIEVQGVPEFSQVFASEYRVRVEFKSPAKSCLRPVWARQLLGPSSLAMDE